MIAAPSTILKVAAIFQRIASDCTTVTLTLDPSSFLQSDKRSLLFRSPFTVSLSAANDLFTQRDFYSELPIVGRPFLADEVIGGCDSIVRLRKLLKKRFVILI